MWNRLTLCACVLVMAAAASAQESTPTPLIEIPVDQLDLGDGFDPNLGLDPEAEPAPLDQLLEELGGGPVEAPREEVADGPTGTLRVLDKLTGEVVDLELAAGETRELGFLAVTVSACRYPVENPTGDAFVFVRAYDLRKEVDVFSGWMIASAPALNAIDHPRYDVWALRCSTS